MHRVTLPFSSYFSWTTHAAEQETVGIVKDTETAHPRSDHDLSSSFRNHSDSVDKRERRKKKASG